MDALVGDKNGHGISTRVTLSYAKRHYKQLISLTFVRKREYASTLTLWHRDLYFWGLRPRLHGLIKSESNHPSMVTIKIVYS
ncbi:MAG: surface lipoprotein assembly modifier [Haemophilus parainfluenzae]